MQSSVINLNHELKCTRCNAKLGKRGASMEEVKHFAADHFKWCVQNQQQRTAE